MADTDLLGRNPGVGGTEARQRTKEQRRDEKGDETGRSQGGAGANAKEGHEIAVNDAGWWAGNKPLRAGGAEN